MACLAVMVHILIRNQYLPIMAGDKPRWIAVAEISMNGWSYYHWLLLLAN